MVDLVVGMHEFKARKNQEPQVNLSDAAGYKAGAESQAMPQAQAPQSVDKVELADYGQNQ